MDADDRHCVLLQYIIDAGATAATMGAGVAAVSNRYPSYPILSFISYFIPVQYPGNISLMISGASIGMIFFFLASVFHILATKCAFWPDLLSFWPASTFCFPTEPTRFGILILTNSAEFQCRNHARTRTGPISDRCFQSRTDGTLGQS